VFKKIIFTRKKYILHLLIKLKFFTMKKWSTTTKILVGLLTVGVIGTGSYLIYKAVKKSSDAKSTKSESPVKQDRKINIV
jgi:hypothetical protein